MALAALWVTGLLAYQLPGPGWLATGVAMLWLLLALWAAWQVARGHGTRRLGLSFGASLALAGLWWLLLTPRQDRVWADDVAQRLHVVSFDGRHVVLDNVRDFTWRSETDYDARWVRREYDLDQLRSADLVLSYWMGPAIAHTLISFGFDDGRHVVFSLEIRKERGESFSALGGFFRKFEMTLVASEETDIIRTRTNARGEDVYLYRLHGLSPEKMRELLRFYVDRAQQLEQAPRFYNTLTSNCTTVVFELMRRIQPNLPLDYRLLLSGYLAAYAEDVGGLTPGVPLAQLQQTGRITLRAREAGDVADFSSRIRAGVPGIPPQGNTP